MRLDQLGLYSRVREGEDLYLKKILVFFQLINFIHLNINLFQIYESC